MDRGAGLGSLAALLCLGALAAAAARAASYSVLDLGTLPGMTLSQASDINNQGQVVGMCQDSTGANLRSFLYTGGTMADMLPGTNSVAQAINNQGQVTGWLRHADNSRDAFLYSGGQWSTLPTVAGNPIEPNAINNSGQIVGTGMIFPVMQYYAFKYDGTTTTNLGLYGTQRAVATSINDSGDFIVNGSAYNYQIGRAHV